MNRYRLKHDIFRLLALRIQAQWLVTQADTQLEPVKELALPTHEENGIKHETLTRTIWVSCLSHFLLLLLHPRQICNGCCTGHPCDAARICPQLKSCTVINFWLRDSLYRDTAPVPATNFVTGDKFAAPIKLVPRHA